MPFDAADPRATLAPPDSDPPAGAAGFADPQFLPFTDETASVSVNGNKTWFVRVQNAAIAFTTAAQGSELDVLGTDAERIVAVVDDAAAIRITQAGRDLDLVGRGVAILPPGHAVITAVSQARVLQVFTTQAADVLERAINAHAYRNIPPNVQPHQASVARETGPVALRLSDFPPSTARFGTIFRSTNLMLNFINDRNGPRDATKLSPHTHADFEQCSIQLEGQFIHHARTPWIPDSTTWRDDKHYELNGAGAVVFPPPLVHTSQAVGDGVNRLMDVFAPPRQDFLAKPGWVVNASDYEGQDASPTEGTSP